MKNVKRIHNIMATAHPSVLELCDEIASEEITTMGQVRAEFGYSLFYAALVNGLVDWEKLTGYLDESQVWLTVDGMAVANHVLACRELENAIGNDLDHAMDHLNGGK